MLKFKPSLLILLLPLIRPFLFKVFDGECPNLKSEFAVKFEQSETYMSVAQLPFESIKPEVFFFPTNAAQFSSVYMHVTDTMIVWFPTFLACNFVGGLHIDQGSMQSTLAMMSVKPVGRRPQFKCLLNTNISSSVWSFESAILVWGCVNLVGMETHEEALWLFVNENERKNMTFSKFLINKHIHWMSGQLQAKSSRINLSDLNYHSLNFFKDTLEAFENDPDFNNKSSYCSNLKCPASIESYLYNMMIAGVFALGLMLLMCWPTCKSNRVNNANG